MDASDSVLVSPVVVVELSEGLVTPLSVVPSDGLDTPDPVVPSEGLVIPDSVVGLVLSVPGMSAVVVSD